MTLISHWKLDETSGTNVEDSVGDNDGTSANDTSTMTVTGKINNALEFNGGDDFITVSDDASLNFGTGDFTLVAWIKTSAGGLNRYIINKEVAGETYYSLLLYDGIPYFFVANIPDEFIAQGTDDLRDGLWHHIVGVRNQTNVLIYVDGVLKDSQSATPISADNAADAYLGCSLGISSFFDGSIDDVRIYDEALSQIEITNLQSDAANKNTFWVNNSGTWVKFDHYDYFKVKKKQNQVSEFEVKIFDISTAQKAYFKEQAEVLFFAGTNMILKGRIQNIEYASAYEVIARGFGMESLLLDKQFIKAGDARIQYTNESAQTAATEINSDILTTHSSGLWASDFGDVSLRFEHANRLNALGKLSEAIDYYWWVSQTSSDDYDADYIHLNSNQGETSSQKTYNLTSSMVESKQEKEVTNLVNYVHALGYGDGINQLKTSVYAASTQSSFLDANIEATNTTITVADGSIFDSTGSARIAEEVITYTGTTSTTLTNVTRGVGTTAKPHNKNCYIEQHYTTDSSQTGSSIQVYGLMDHTLIDRTIIDEETLEVISSGYLSDRKTPILRITITPDEPLADAGLNIGDNVTITDSEADIDGDYRIVGQTYRSDYGHLTSEIEASNRSLEFIEQMNKSKQDAEAMAKYMQGSTNIYALGIAENCDENYDLDMRFYLPDEAKAINKVELSFQLEDYRAYSKTNANESSHTHGLTILDEPASGNQYAISIKANQLYASYGANGGVQTSETGSAHTHGINFGITSSTLTSPSVDLTVGTDGGSMDTIGTYTDSTNTIDITSAVSKVGAGNWININFAANKKMRIEANAYVQIFIESK